MSTNGYAKIERGETRLTIPKLEQIVQVFDIDILELMSLGEKIYIQDSDNHSINIINPTSQDLSTEIVKFKHTISHLQEILEAKNELIALQKSQLDALQKVIDKLSN